MTECAPAKMTGKRPWGEGMGARCGTEGERCYSVVIEKRISAKLEDCELQDTRPKRLNWQPAIILPSLRAYYAIDYGSIALVSETDVRLKKLMSAYPRFRSFLSRFKDAFGQKVEPSVLIFHSDIAKSLSLADAILGFRDAVAVSTVAYSRAQLATRRHSNRIVFSDVFNFYPWMMDKYDDSLIVKTPASLGLHDVNEFHGQPTPGIPIGELREFEIDAPTLDLIKPYWQKILASDDLQWRHRALFRSLNMAYQASLMPTAAGDSTLYDIGRQLAMWVSAFEILVHPGLNGKSDLQGVVSVLTKADWNLQECAALDYEITSKGRTIQSNLAGKTYEMLYKARNHFLHGNPVSKETILIGKSGGMLPQIVAPLYRVALHAFLKNGSEDKREVTIGDIPSLVHENLDRNEKQQAFEKALLAVWFGKESLRSTPR
jgi:hypothetical protein